MSPEPPPREPSVPPPPAPRQDNHGPVEFGARLADDVIMALRFYSRLPTGDRPHELPNLSRIALALPFASVLIGLGPVVIAMASAALGLPALLAATLGVVALVLVTGAMAEDALADAMDGLFGGQTIERRLEIMKDSRHGTFGVVAIVLLLAIRITAVGGALAVHPLAGGAMWLAAMSLSRPFSLWLTVELQAARANGASAAAGRVGKRSFAIGLGFSVLIAFALAAPATSFFALILAVAACGAVAMGWTAICRRLAGGQTGDLIGALQALVEVAVLCVLVAFV